MVSSTLIALIAQRMVRRICGNCRVSDTPSPHEQNIFRREMSQELTTTYRGTGCHLCAGTGYQGRTGIFELLVVSNEIKKMLINNTAIGELKEQAIRDGMLAMKQDGMVKVREGITTFDEVMNSVFTIG